LNKCIKCGKEGDSTQIKTCPEQILDYANKPICKECYIGLKKNEENKFSYSKSLDNLSKSTQFNGKIPGKYKDWLILVIQALGLFLFSYLIGYFYFEFSNSESYFEKLTITLIIVKSLFAIIVIFIFFRESKKWSDKGVFQTLIFSLLLIPYIFTMFYFIGLLLPQLFYWGVQHFEWNKSKFNIYESWKSLLILGLGLIIIGIYMLYLDLNFNSGGTGFLNLSIGDQGLLFFFFGLISTIIGLFFKIKN
jgi:hypothetical protein